MPPFLRGRNFVIVEGFFMGSEEDGVELMRPLRELGAEIDTFAMVPPAGISELHMDPPNPLPYTGGGTSCSAISPPEAIDALVAAVGPGSGSPLVSYELRHIGGALAREEDGPRRDRVAPGHVPLVRRRRWSSARSRSARPARGSSSSGQRARRRTTPGRKYLNFTEQETDPAVFYPAETWERLRAVKAEVDPGRLFRANHSIDPAS